MIAPSTGPDEPTIEGLQEAVDAFFRPGGRLDKACSNEPFPYEPRPQQRQMAAAVAETIGEGGHLAVEAGTGVGKSFAYLVPAILAAKRSGSKAVISTYTISLQEQLMYKDIPFLQEHLGIEFRAALVKGRSNYLCLRRLARTRRMAKDLFKTSPEAELEYIRNWADETDDGSLQDLSPQPSRAVWDLVCAEQGNCLWSKCPEHDRCHFIQSRAQMQDADVLIVNHHLFFSDLALRAQGAGFLPAYDFVVLDEAHCLESVATEHMGLRLSQYGFEHWLRRLYVPETQKGLLGLLRRGEEAHLVGRVWDEVRAFFKEVEAWADLSGDKSQRVVDGPMGIETSLPGLVGKVTSQLRDLAEELEDRDLKAELQSACRRGADLRHSLDSYLCQGLEDNVYWVEREGRRRQMVLYSAPIEVGPALEQNLFGTCESVVMTSATLAVHGEMDFFCRRVGAESCRRLSVGSPFDYARQMRVFLAPNMPEPNQAEAFMNAAEKAVQHFVARTHGHAFVLFTSSQVMRRMADRVSGYLADHGYPLLVQDGTVSRHVMLERFQKEPRSVLFGLDSFWMGVDVRGDALRNVMVMRLPFAVPDHPVVKARTGRIKEKGGDPFREYSLPEAVLKFRQGVGRLIRTATDEGIVVVLDSRIAKKWYGRFFLEALPDCPVEQIDSL